jgi:RHS repeat-associated protein
MTLDSNHNMVATVVPTPWSVTTAGAWTYEAGSYQVPANVAYVYFYANVYQSSGTTTARFDDGFAIFGTHYFHPDQLSTRLTTDATGAVIGQQGHFPFGESWYAQNTTTNWQFTSYQRDAESGNDYAMARSYVNRLARFSSPDPADFTAANPINPQSWNRYAYVLDNPLGNVDPLGLDPCAGSNLTWISNFANGTGIFDPQDCSANGGSWDPPDTTVYVTASPLPSPSPSQDLGGLLSNSSGGGGTWVKTFTKTFLGNLVSPTFYKTTVRNVAACAGPLAQKGSVTNLSGGRVPELLGSNFFGDIAQLSTGSGEFDQGASAAIDVTLHTAPEIGAQTAVGTVFSIGRAISNTPGVYNPISVGSTTLTLGMTRAGSFVLKGLGGLTTGKMIFDATIYGSAAIACAVVPD